MHWHAWYEGVDDVRRVIIAGQKLLRAARSARSSHFDGQFVIEELQGGRLLKISLSLCGCRLPLDRRVALLGAQVSIPHRKACNRLFVRDRDGGQCQDVLSVVSVEGFEEGKPARQR